MGTSKVEVANETNSVTTPIGSVTVFDGGRMLWMACPRRGKLHTEPYARRTAVRALLGGESTVELEPFPGLPSGLKFTFIHIPIPEESQHGQ